MSKHYSDAQKAAYYAKKAGISLSKKSSSKKKKAAAAPGAKKKKRRSGYRRPTWGRDVGGAIARFAGGNMLAPVGEFVGDAAQSIVKNITGWGDYKVQVNSLFPAAAILTDSVPEFKNVGARCTIVKHREFIQDVVSSSSAGLFDLKSFRVNPGSSDTFPWLSRVAANYEQYRMMGLIFEYKTSSGAISTTGQLGTVIMATQYNSLSPAFLTKQEMENYEFGCSVVASQSLIHPIECDPQQTQCGGVFNIDSTDQLPPVGDLRLYDLGKFSIATAGMPNASETVGELWVSYEVCLMKPRLVSDSGALADHYQFATGITGTDYFGTDAVITSGSDQFTSLSSGPSNTIVFDRSFNGNVVVLYTVAGTTGATATDPTITPSSGATALSLLNNDTSFTNLAVYDEVSNVMHNYWFFSIQPIQGVAASPTLTFSSGKFVPTPNQGDLFIIEIPDELN